MTDARTEGEGRLGPVSTRRAFCIAEGKTHHLWDFTCGTEPSYVSSPRWTLRQGFLGFPGWSSGWGSELPMQEAQIWFLVRELRGLSADSVVKNLPASHLPKDASFLPEKPAKRSQQQCIWLIAYGSRGNLLKYHYLDTLFPDLCLLFC